MEVVEIGAAPARKVEVEIRRYTDGPDCDVVVTTQRRRLVMNCPTYELALRWALLECKVYKIPPLSGQSPAVPRRGQPQTYIQQAV